MSHAIESSPLMPGRPSCPKCRRKRWITVVFGKQKDCACQTCGHTWRER